MAFLASGAAPDSVVPPAPMPECDVVMKGGITSGVVYPMALQALGSRYRIRGIGGASAGAIGAAVGAAAEFGRSSGGFDRLCLLPGRLGDGALAALFHPQPSTKQLLRLMLVATGNDRAGADRKRFGKTTGLIGALVQSFPIAGLCGAAPGVAFLVIGMVAGGVAGWLLVVTGLIMSIVGWCVSMALRLWRKFTVDVPGNLFGICRGLGLDPEHPGFTDWLCDQIDEIADLPVSGPPLTFGQLLTSAPQALTGSKTGRQIDLRMITTCLSEGVPYEMPWDARRFFFDPAEWRTLFPERVVAALEAAPPVSAHPEGDPESLRREERSAAQNDPPLRRLPDPQYLPVVVATRLSLSFPLLISAVPLWTIDRRNSRRVADETSLVDQEDVSESPLPDLRFSRLWFTDGGFCSNFPVHLFDAALPARPTFAINLGRFPAGRVPSADERENVEWARNNRPLLPTHVELPTRGLGALVGFASAALNTSRNWQDSTQLDQPGYRDRIVRVLQTKAEGGLNLFMENRTIDGLAERGRTAATVMVEQFTEPQYPAKNPVATGWDNHRWVRYRALLSVLPEWLRSYEHGHAALDSDPSSPPSYRLKVAERKLASQITDALDQVADVVASADPEALAGLTSAPRPKGLLRRIPQI